MKKIDELLKSIDKYAVFWIGTDADSFLFSIAAGGDIPMVAAWCNKGFRPSKMYDDEFYAPISRRSFFEQVRKREDFY